MVLVKIRIRKTKNNGCFPGVGSQEAKMKCKVYTLHNAHNLKTEKWRHENKCRVWRAHIIEINRVKYYLTQVMKMCDVHTTRFHLVDLKEQYNKWHCGSSLELVKQLCSVQHHNVETVPSYFSIYKCMQL